MLLQSPSLKIQDCIIEALIVLFSRSVPFDDPLRSECIIDPVFVDGGIQIILITWCRIHGVENPALIGQAELSFIMNEEKYHTAKRFAHVYTILTLDDSMFGQSPNICKAMRGVTIKFQHLF